MLNSLVLQQVYWHADHKIYVFGIEVDYKLRYWDKVLWWNLFLWAKCVRLICFLNRVDAQEVTSVISTSFMLDGK
jgi:hypothetical protein